MNDVPATVAGELHGAYVRLESAIHELGLARSHFFEAEMAAQNKKMPSADYRRMGEHVDSVVELIEEKFPEIASKPGKKPVQGVSYS